MENLESPLENNFSDSYWISNEGGIQSKYIKHATFDLPSIDNELTNEINYQNITDEIELLVKTLTTYEELYEKLITENKLEILKYFKNHQLKYFNYKVFGEILKREIILLSHVLKLKQGVNDEILKQKIEKEFFLDEGAFYDMIIDVKSMDINLTEEDKIELKEIVKQAMKYEEELIKTKEMEYVPSYTSLLILLKVIRATVEDGINNIKLLEKKHEEKVLIDFFNILIKFEIFITLIPLAIKIKDDELFNLREDSEKWEKMKKNYQRKVKLCNFKI
jgi:hypothetical protein